MDLSVYLEYCGKVKENYAEYKVGVHRDDVGFALTFRGHCLRWLEERACYYYRPDDPNGGAPIDTGLDALISFDDAASIGIAEDIEFLLMQ